MKRTIWSEAAYFLGTLFISLGVALMVKADFGVDMVGAPSYLLHLKLSTIFPSFTYGFAEFTFQGSLLVLLSLFMRRFKLSYLFSFATAGITGLCLDMWISVLSGIIVTNIIVRLVIYVASMLSLTLGISFLLRTYITPSAPELVIKDVVEKYHFKVARVKIAFDGSCYLISLIMSFAFFGFGNFVGIKLGTIVCAFANGWFIGMWDKLLGRTFVVKDALKLRRLFKW